MGEDSTKGTEAILTDHLIRIERLEKAERLRSAVLHLTPGITAADQLANMKEMLAGRTIMKMEDLDTLRECVKCLKDELLFARSRSLGASVVYTTLNDSLQIFVDIENILGMGD